MPPISTLLWVAAHPGFPLAFSFFFFFFPFFVVFVQVCHERLPAQDGRVHFYRHNFFQDVYCPWHHERSVGVSDRCADWPKTIWSMDPRNIVGRDWWR